MKYELFIARKLKLGGDNKKNSTPSLNIALIGIVLAIIVMIMSITIVCGFKKEISNKIYNLDSHIRVSNSSVTVESDNYSTVDSRDILPALRHSSIIDSLSSVSLIAEKPAILKTNSDFKGIVYKGVGDAFNWDYYKSSLISGRIPNLADSANIAEIIISKTIATQLRLNVGDKILTYFIDNSVKVRNSLIVGIYATDFDEYDKTYILGNIKAIQNINHWNQYTGTYIGIDTKYISSVRSQAYNIYRYVSKSTIERESPILYYVTDTTHNNMSYFSWLKLLDMNVVIIIVLMTVVSAFTLVAGLLMIVLGRINLIGMLKTLGATNSSIRRIFMLLTQRLIFKSLIIGNILGLLIALLQQHFHFLRLDAEAYYIPYVPIDIDWISILILNVAIIVISYITLVAPSFIISSIKPSKSIKFE